MKNLFIAATLFIAFAAQAQTITQDSLLGRWQLVKLDLDGFLADVQTGAVTAKNPDNTDSEELQIVQEMLQTPAFQDFKEHPIVFKPGGIIEIPGSNGANKGGYSFVNQNGTEVLYVALRSNITFPASLKNGMLHVSTGGADPGAGMYFKKETQ
jgi:hypothetical protein